MKFMDFHCDTLYRLTGLGKTDTSDLWENDGQVDLKRLLTAGYGAQFFAAYIDLGAKPFGESYMADALFMGDILKRAIKDNDQVGLARHYQDFENNMENGKLSAFLSVEDGGIIGQNIENLEKLYQEGFRLITLTWNYENCLGYPNFNYEYQFNGLKPFGFEVLSRMDELGIMADVAHLSDGGFFDVMKHGKRPPVASHSNARALKGHSRNLTDEMIRFMGQREGLICVNYTGYFLNDEDKGTLESLLKHVRHIMNLGGAEIVALGSDFDGIRDVPELGGAHQMDRLVPAMEKMGFTINEIEGLCHRNGQGYLKRFFG